MLNRPLPLGDAPRTELARVRAVLADIDDTLTSDGRLPALAYRALEDLCTAGFRVVPITGRPAGWCDMIARFWPVAGVVGENGAFAFRYDHARKKMERRYARSAPQRAADRHKLDALAAEIVTAVPGAAISADQAYREADLAIDYCEDVPPLARTAVAQIVALFERAGARAKVSSIHVNGWFGDYDKLSTTRTFLADALGVDLAQDGDSVAFIGDSPNDGPLFAALPMTVGVANVLDFVGEIAVMPSYVTQGRGGDGFAEFASALLSATPR